MASDKEDKYSTEVKIIREILLLKTDSDGYAIEPGKDSAKWRKQENLNRERAAAHGFYADHLTKAGIGGRGYDKNGNYRCGECNMANGVKCLFVAVKKLDLKAGSCQHWETVCGGDPEIQWERYEGGGLVTPDEASYGIAANGQGFGCKRCPLASESKLGPDDAGRYLFCKHWNCRVDENACCKFNDAKSVKIDEDGMPTK